MWESCRTSGVYLPTEFGTDGFIHLSGLHQVLTPANRFYAGRRDLVALVVDAHLISNALVWEPGTGTQEHFPHLYGALGADAVLAEIPVPTGDRRVLFVATRPREGCAALSQLSVSPRIGAIGSTPNSRSISP